MNRPTVTEEIKLEAAKIIAARLGDCDAKTIAQHYRDGMDGYDLAKDLDDYAGWDITVADVEELDSMRCEVESLLEKAEKEWFKQHPMEPPYPIGTEIMQGVIERIDEHHPGSYLVKENGCTQDNRWLIVKFEDAKAA